LSNAENRRHHKKTKKKQNKRTSFPHQIDLLHLCTPTESVLPLERRIACSLHRKS
jgi:hypothetical protein